MDLCDYCLKAADHTHPPCGHCHGTGRCPHPFCIVCTDPRYDDLPFPCGTCLSCAGEGIDFSFRANPAIGVQIDAAAFYRALDTATIPDRTED